MTGQQEQITYQSVQLPRGSGPPEALKIVSHTDDGELQCKVVDISNVYTCKADFTLQSVCARVVVVH